MRIVRIEPLLDEQCMLVIFGEENRLADFLSRFNTKSVFHHVLQNLVDGRAVFTDKVLVTGHYGFGRGPTELTTTDLVLRKHDDLVALRSLYLSDDGFGFNLDHTVDLTAD